MDIASTLYAYGSRKQLRRLAADLGLQADEPGGLEELLALEPGLVRASVLSTIAGAERQVQRSPSAGVLPFCCTPPVSSLGFSIGKNRAVSPQ